MISQKHFVGFVYHKDPSKATYYDNTQKTDEAAFSLTEMRERAKKMGAARAFCLILILLNRYGEIVNGALIHANRLALGWTEGYFCIVAAPWQFASQPSIT